MLTILVACDGRTSWRHEALPDYGPAPPPAPLSDDAPRVRLRIELGDVVIALYADQAPISTRNFLGYVDERFFDGTLVHRVTRVPMVVVQGGGLLPGFAGKPTREPVLNEAGNGLSNVRGTVAMARTAGEDTATSQFFFNVTDNSSLLDRQGERRPGYAVFGYVIEGQDVVDRMSMTPTHQVAGTARREAPVDDLVIESIAREPARR